MPVKVSVIIAHDSRRGNELLNRCLLSVQKELDHCLLFDKELSSEVLVESRGSSSEARNLAAGQAEGEILVFVDDDAELRAGCLREILEPFSDPVVGVVGGVNVPFPQISLNEQLSSSLLASPFVMLKSASRYTPRGGLRVSDESELLSAFMAVRSKAFREAGGFPIDVIPCEENVLVNRIQGKKWKVLYNPFAVVYHKRPRLWWPYMKTIYHYGYGRGLMIRKLGTEGKPRMIWRPSWRWMAYALAFLLHVFSYGAGLCMGYVRNRNHRINKAQLEAQI